MSALQADGVALIKQKKNSRSWCKSKVKCSQYCHLVRRDYGNAGTVGEGSDAAIVSISESGEDNR